MCTKNLLIDTGAPFIAGGDPPIVLHHDIPQPLINYELLSDNVHQLLILVSIR